MMAVVLEDIIKSDQPKTRIELESLTREATRGYDYITQNFGKIYSLGLNAALRKGVKLPTHDIVLSGLTDNKIFGTTKKSQLDFIMGEHNMNAALKLSLIHI